MLAVKSWVADRAVETVLRNFMSELNLGIDLEISAVLQTKQRSPIGRPDI
jgi:hypothetical protein